MATTIKLSLSSSTIPVVLQNGDTAIDAELHEMNAAQRDQYLDGLAKRMKTDATGKVSGVNRFEGMQAELLLLCLKRKDGTPFTEKDIQSWPATAVTELFKAAQSLNNLTKTDEDAAKNG